MHKHIPNDRGAAVVPCMAVMLSGPGINKAGRFDYACDFHPSMQGVVTVKESGLDT